MTLTAIRPLVGSREGARDGRVERRPGGLVDVGAEGALELVVGVVGAEEVGVADEELLVVVGGVDEPAGDVVGRVAADDAGRRVVDVEAVDLDLELPRPPAAGRMSMSGLPKTVNRLPLRVFLSSSSAIARSGFIRAVRTVSLPKRIAAPVASSARASKAKPHTTRTSK